MVTQSRSEEYQFDIKRKFVKALLIFLQAICTKANDRGGHLKESATN